MLVPPRFRPQRSLGLSGRSGLRRLTVTLAAGATLAVVAGLASPARAAVPIAPGTAVLTEISWTDWAGATDSQGDHNDWAEIAAPGPAAVDLSGAGLSDKTNSPFKWRFPAGTTVPAGGYLLVWLSGKDRVLGGAPHTSFSISAGDSLQLTAPDGTALDTVATPAAGKRDVSWCRPGTPAQATGWQYCATPTAGKANTGVTSPALLARPVLSQAGGLYAGPVTVTATGPAGATIRYTKDGSEPSATSPVWTGPLTVSASASVRATAFAAGAISSPVTTSEYVIGASVPKTHAGQRVVLVTMSPADASAQASGTKDKKWASNVQVIGPDGKSLAAADAETDVPGQVGSLISPQKGIDVTFRSAMGTSSIDAQLIPDRPTTTYRRFRLRNGGNDWNETRLRDVQGAALAYGGPNLSSGFVPTAVYVNGAYYGELELREKEDETLVESYTGADRDDVDFITDPLQGLQEVNNGQDALASYQAMYNAVTTKDMTDPAAYAAATKLLNPLSLADDWVLHLWTDNYDWPNKNVHVWRSPALDGRWNWQPHDFDTTFGALPSSPNGLARLADNNNVYTQKGSELISALLKNPTFRTLYINTAADALNTRLSTASSTALLAQEAAELEPFIAKNRDRYFFSPDLALWKSNVASQRSFLTGRVASFDAEIQKKFSVSARQSLGVSVNSPGDGSVKVNSIDLSGLITAAKPRWQGSYYPQAPVTLTAVPRPGQVFTGWTGASTSASRSITLPVKAATEITATFGPAPATQTATVTAPAPRADTVGDVVRVPVVASDPSGLPLSYDAKKLPSGVDLNASNGVIYGRLTKPEKDDVTISVSNGVTTTKVTFTWTVANPA